MEVSTRVHREETIARVHGYERMIPYSTLRVSHARARLVEPDLILGVHGFAQRAGAHPSFWNMVTAFWNILCGSNRLIVSSRRRRGGVGSLVLIRWTPT